MVFWGVGDRRCRQWTGRIPSRPCAERGVQPHARPAVDTQYIDSASSGTSRRQEPSVAKLSGHISESLSRSRLATRPTPSGPQQISISIVAGTDCTHEGTDQVRTCGGPAAQRTLRAQRLRDLLAGGPTCSGQPSTSILATIWRKRARSPGLWKCRGKALLRSCEPPRLV
jgi:hypothetical protein